MGNVVETLAFIPPNHPQAHEQLKYENKENLKMLTNSLGNAIAILWYDFDAPYTILYSHGNAEDLASSKAAFEDLAITLEVNFCAYDYSGYGLSSGQCSEEACYSDIECVLQYLTKEVKKPMENIILFGRSLGSGPTIDLASKYPNLAGMILQSPLRSVIKTQVPDWVGFVLQKIDMFPNEEKITKIRTFPVFIIHGKLDAVVPYSHGLHLYQELKKNNTSVDYFWVSGCGHNDIEYKQGRRLKKRLIRFIDTYIRNVQISIENKDYNNNNANVNQCNSDAYQSNQPQTKPMNVDVNGNNITSKQQF